MIIEIDLNRDKLLDDAIFIAILGLDLCRDKEYKAGSIEIEKAIHKFETVLKALKENTQTREELKEMCP